MLLILFWPGSGSLAKAVAPGKPATYTKPIIRHYPEPQIIFEARTLTLPIKRAGNLIIIEAEIDGVTGNFVLDTGAPYLVLNATYFRDMPAISNQHSAGVNGEVAQSFSTEVGLLKMNELQYKHVRADVTDLSPIENSRQIKILGLLGTQLFTRLALTVDLFKNTLYIHQPSAGGAIELPQGLNARHAFSTDFKLMNNVIFIRSLVGANTFWLVFDTGAEATLLDYRRTKKLINQLSIKNTAKLTAVGGSTFQIIYATLDTLIINGNTFSNNPVMLTSLDNMGRAYGQSVDGMLGYDFFAKHVFTINFAQKEITFYKTE